MQIVKLEVQQKYIPLVALYILSGGLPNPFHLEDIAIESKKFLLLPSVGQNIKST